MAEPAPAPIVSLAELRADPLARLRAATQALAVANLEDARHLRDLAEAARVYARQAQLGLEAQNYAAEVKLRAERRVGELLPGMVSHGRPGKTSRDVTLSDLGISYTQSQRWQAVASVPEEAFEDWLGQLRQSAQEITTAGALRLAELARGPRPVPEPGSSPAPASPPPLLRFCPPGMPSAAIVSSILRVAFTDAETALDMTYGLGRFWDGSAHVRVTALDAEPARAPDGIADARALPYADSSFDVALFDPPHLADGGAESIMALRFGTLEASALVELVRGGSAEAWRVARLGVIVKATDGVHNQRYTAMSDWVRAAIGVPLYDVVHETRATPLVDPKWGQQLSAYNNGATYLVFRRDGPLHTRRSWRIPTLGEVS